MRLTIRRAGRAERGLPMKVAYMGTPDFAVAPLQALLAAGHEVTAVVTQPDKPKGRGAKMVMPPVKVCALEHGIPVFQPQKIREPKAVETVRGFAADVFVVAAFGQILSREILEIPKYGCINIHASLLPAYRGAAPMQWAILNGEKQTGVTIMQMDEGIDTGDMLLKRAVPIEETETDQSLQDKLAKVGSSLIVEALKKLEAGLLRPVRQTEADSSYASRLTKSMGELDWNLGAQVLDQKVRGLYSWPGAYTYFRGKLLKICEAHPVLEEADGQAGTVSAVTKEAIIVNTGKQKLSLLQVQPESKKRMAVKDFLLGYKVGKGEKLG